MAEPLPLPKSRGCGRRGGAPARRADRGDASGPRSRAEGLDRQERSPGWPRLAGAAGGDHPGALHGVRGAARSEGGHQLGRAGGSPRPDARRGNGTGAISVHPHPHWPVRRACCPAGFAKLLSGGRRCDARRSRTAEAGRGRPRPRATCAHCREPFRGLRPFEEEHHHLFFGRERETEELVELLRRKRLLMVVGDSGSGKSSLVKAGLSVPVPWRGT